MTQVISADPAVRTGLAKSSKLSGIKRKHVWVYCEECGKPFDNKFKYVNCYPCAQARWDARKTDKIDINQAILATAKRKAEIKARG